MKLVKKASLLLSLLPILLTSCDFEKRYFCLDTYYSPDYLIGYCMEVDYRDINETAYIFCLPNNPEADESAYEYEITWNNVLNPNWFSFVDGLAGKKVDNVKKLGNNSVKIDFHGLVHDTKATHGYLKVLSQAFESHSVQSENATLYAYFSIGEYERVTAKPVDISF